VRQQKSSLGAGPSKKEAKNKARTQGLKEDQKQDIREAFDLFDKDGNGDRLD
jgi:centrin-1